MLPLSVIDKNFPRRVPAAMPTPTPVDTKTIADVNHNFFLTTTEAFPSCKPMMVRNLHAVGNMMKHPASTSEHLGALLILLFVLISFVTHKSGDEKVRKTKDSDDVSEPLVSSPRDLTAHAPKAAAADDDSLPSLHQDEPCDSSVLSTSSSVSLQSGVGGNVDAHAASDDEDATKTREEIVVPEKEETPVTKEENFDAPTPASKDSHDDDDDDVPPTSSARTSLVPSYSQTAMLSAAAVAILAVSLSRSRK